MEKKCLITGANSGIGKATAIGLARLGFDVTIACRNEQKGEAALAEIRHVSGNTSADLMLVDLADLTSVRKLAGEYTKKHQRLDVLVNNAGLILTKRTVTVDGFETTFQVNYLSHFFLTHLLLEELKKDAPTRIINVSSSAHTSASIHFEDLQLATGYGAFKSYGQSKLAQVLFTYELARRLTGTKVDVNCVHPGAVASNWGRGGGDWLAFGLRLASVFEMSPAKGAETSIYLASDPGLKGVTGRYFSNKKETRSSDASYDQAAARRLWDASCHMLDLSS